MKFIADLHIHSHYSRATSQELNIEPLYEWAQRKGIQVVATGDITHPGWLEEIKRKLEPAEPGLFRVKGELARPIDSRIPKACRGEVRFILSGEISNIYKKGDQVRKVHNVVYFPSIEVAERFQVRLERIGNIRSDGRPILGLDARDLLELVLESDPQSFLIPAHIWTPWFSVLGSKSGFDSIEECFEDLTPQIFALETGLSSDPPMNWMLSKLDRFALVSNSDAHSPAKLGREANLFDAEFSYPGILNALKGQGPDRLLGTIEFFPEEGKYHLDGHRKCNRRMTPAETIANHELCPVCGKKVTVGVLYRVQQLADRPAGSSHPNARPYHSLIPLSEVLAEILSVGEGSKAVIRKFEQLVEHLGSELTILMELPIDDIDRWGGPMLAEAIRRMRAKQVQIAAGYDGEFGTIRLFSDEERHRFQTQYLFVPEEILSESTTIPDASSKKVRDQQASFPAGVDIAASAAISTIEDEEEDETGLNRQQREAVTCRDRHLLIVAGPGTGKTRTLTHRIAHLVQEHHVPPEQILAITFTNRAAEEMRERLIQLLLPEDANRITIKTFHAFGASILRQEAALLGYQSNFSIYSETDKRQLLRRLTASLSSKELDVYSERIATIKNQLHPILSEIDAAFPDIDGQFQQILKKYQATLKDYQAFDFDDLIAQPILIFKKHPRILKRYQDRYRWISIDEYQDINLAQYQLLRLLAGPQANICAIGDPDQAIYGFRGADRKFFLQFEQDYAGCKVIRLEKNYRSSQTIVQAATQVIRRNSDHQTLNLWSPIMDRVKVDIFEVPTEKAEAETIVHQIERMMGATSFFSVDSGRAGEAELESCSSFSDIAVFYRVTAQLSALEEAFIRSGIPYQSFGEVPFYETPEVSEIITVLKAIHNPHADPELMRLIQMPPRSLSESTLKLLINYQKSNEFSLWHAMQKSHQIAWLSPTQKQPIELWVEMIQTAQRISQTEKLPAIIQYIIEAFGLAKYFKNDRKRQHFWKQLIERTANFNGSLGEFLELIALQKETDIYVPNAEKVTLMTLHAAKGLEFPVVFIAGCEEGLLPYHRAGSSIENIEEERRLFYVGMTRAKKRLILLHAKSRFLFGERTTHRPSRFLNEIDAALKYKQRAELKAKKVSKENIAEQAQLRLF
ncbi:MAG: UvrD-helicase domain-containing protein [candidate division KSB1 bacterium]|nr:UvrD-helicase domain-containing protein [candidate division KSB1 bacterium]